MARRDAGYTLVELAVVIMIFGTVMALITLSFNRIVASSGQVIKTVETDIGGLIGLEVFRVDLGFAGFGLPWSLGGASYSEADSHLVDDIEETDAASFNDSPDHPPRAFVMLNNKGFNGSDYLVLKGTALGLKKEARSWSYLNYSSKGAVLKPSKSEIELVPDHGDRVIVVNTRPRGGLPTRELVTQGSSFVTSLDREIDDPFRPKSSEDRYLVYGLLPAPKDSEDVISFPFNRADYYVGPSETLSSNCAPGTGALFRGMVSQKGYFKPMPILDCVADMQVVFMLDTSSDGTPVAWTLDEYAREVALDGGDVAEAIRNHVQEVRVYVLAQQGKRDSGYRFPVRDADRVMVLGDAVNGRAWSVSDLTEKFGRDWLHYHWRIYTIAVQPKNLN